MAGSRLASDWLGASGPKKKFGTRRVHHVVSSPVVERAAAAASDEKRASDERGGYFWGGQKKQDSKQSIQSPPVPASGCAEMQGSHEAPIELVGKKKKSPRGVSSLRCDGLTLPSLPTHTPLSPETLRII